MDSPCGLKLIKGKKKWKKMKKKMKKGLKQQKKRNFETDAGKC